MNTILGKSHPMLANNRHMGSVLESMGFELVSGPELESDWYNFDALNVPKNHPSRDMQDTFWIAGETGKCLRTHCTSVTARHLEIAGKSGTFPCAYASIGKVFRNEATDATHEMQFHQCDGVVVGENVTLADLRNCLTTLYKKLLGIDVPMRFRPSFFPFVEPGLEVWVYHAGRQKWMEVMGAGMLHPNVLKNVGIDPEQYRGFAFGGGADRLTMAHYQIPDIRPLYQGDLRVNQW